MNFLIIISIHRFVILVAAWLAAKVYMLFFLRLCCIFIGWLIGRWLGPAVPTHTHHHSTLALPPLASARTTSHKLPNSRLLPATLPSIRRREGIRRLVPPNNLECDSGPQAHRAASLFLPFPPSPFGLSSRTRISLYHHLYPVLPSYRPYPHLHYSRTPSFIRFASASAASASASAPRIRDACPAHPFHPSLIILPFYASNSLN